jgi:rhamnogalacturonyl hydrolase YesR
MNSFATFGWIGGCVIDALFEEYKIGNDKAYRTLQLHLSHFLDDEKGIIFENPNTIPLDGTFNSIEDFLPMAAIVNLYPDHISIDKALEFLMERKDGNGLIKTNDITTEGCYTVAYPLAAIAAARKDKELAKSAMEQLLHRINHLTVEGAIYQRKNENGLSGFRNWSRGAAWYFLGMIKTIAILEENFNENFDLRQLKKAFKQHSAWVMTLQSEEGLWKGFLDQADATVDTSASAGIATAFVLGYQQGILEDSHLKSAQRCFVALKNHLSMDGFLKGVSQINRSGEKLQESDYRVMSQFGLGLME